MRDLNFRATNRTFAAARPCSTDEQRLRHHRERGAVLGLGLDLQLLLLSGKLRDGCRNLSGVRRGLLRRGLLRSPRLRHDRERGTVLGLGLDLQLLLLSGKRDGCGTGSSSSIQADLALQGLALLQLLHLERLPLCQVLKGEAARHRDVLGARRKELLRALILHSSCGPLEPAVFHSRVRDTARRDKAEQEADHETDECRADRPGRVLIHP